MKTRSTWLSFSIAESPTSLCSCNFLRCITALTPSCKLLPNWPFYNSPTTPAPSWAATWPISPSCSSTLCTPWIWGKYSGNQWKKTAVSFCKVASDIWNSLYRKRNGMWSICTLTPSSRWLESTFTRSSPGSMKKLSRKESRYFRSFWILSCLKSALSK